MKLMKSYIGVKALTLIPVLLLTGPVTANDAGILDIHSTDQHWRNNIWTESVTLSGNTSFSFGNLSSTRSAFVQSDDSFAQISSMQFRQPARYQIDATEQSVFSSHRFSFSQDTGDQVLHFVSSIGDDEYQTHLGTIIGALTLSLSNGSGDTHVKTSNAYQGLNPYFFHGGRSLDYRFNGASASFTFGSKADALLGMVKVETSGAGLEDRYAYFTGFSTKRFYQLFTTYERGNDRAGYGLDLGFNIGRHSVDYQELQSTADAKLRRIGFQFNGKRNNTIRVDLESAYNPLYMSANDNRILVSYSGLLGKRPTRLNATEYGDSEISNRNKKYRKLAIIGGGVAAGAVLVSSGSDNDDSTPRFPNQNAAAFNILNEINPASVRENTEYGGWVFRYPDGTYATTEPVRGNLFTVNIGPPTVAPDGTNSTAYYHTHSGQDERFISEEFSPQDISFGNFYEVDAYLATPLGSFFIHDFETQTIRRLGTVATK